MGNLQRTGPAKPRRQQPDSKQSSQDAHQQEALDEALDESFPASDPVAVQISTAIPRDGGKRDDA